MPAPVLHTPRLHMRPLGAGDAVAWHSIWGDPEVIWWGHQRRAADTALALAGLMDRISTIPPGMGWWMLIDRTSGAAVGDAVLQPAPVPEGEIEIGWHLARDHWGKGYGSESAGAVLEHGLNSLAIERIVATIVPDNQRSIALAERIGMRRVPGSWQRGGLAHGVWEARKAVDPASVYPGRTYPGVSS